MTEPQSVALIREALGAGPVGHLHSNGDYCADRQAHSALWPIDMYAIDRRDIAEVLQHVAALSAQVREMEASRSAMEILANFAHRTAIGAIDRADLENEGRLALAQANDCFPRPPPPDAALPAARGKKP